VRHFLSILLLALPLAAQRPVIRQDVSPSGFVDFSGAAKTTPARIGTTLPSDCTAGELFFLVDTGVFQCINGVFAATGGGGTWGSISGNLSAQVDLASFLKGLQPLVAIGTPAQYIRGDGSLATLPTSYPVATHAATHGKLGADPVAIDWMQIVNAPAVPATAAALGALADPGASGLLKRTAANTSSIASAGTDYVIPSGTTANFSGPLAGDVSGTQNSTVVTRIKGIAAAASATTDTTNASNISSGTLASVRLPPSAAQTNQSNTYTGGTQDFRGAAVTFPAQTGTLAFRPSACTEGQYYFATDPALADGTRLYGCSPTSAWTSVGFGRGTTLNRPTVCSPGDIYFGTDAAAGQNLYFCTAANSWTQMAAGIGGTANPMTTFGDTVYAGAEGTSTRLSGNTTTTRQFLGQVGTGNASAAPVWSVIGMADITAALGYTPENRSSKGGVNGYAPLDGTGRVPAVNLPAQTGAGTVTNSMGALTTGAIVVGNAANDAKTSAVIVDSGNAVSAAGGFISAGPGNGTLALSGTTSGTVSQTVQATTGIWTFTWPSGPAGTHQFLTTDSNGIAMFSQPSAADLAPFGTIPATALPTPTSTTLGGVQAGDCSGSGHIVRIGTNGSVTCSADAAVILTTHASTHASGGSDPVTLAESQITNLTADLAGKQAALGFTPEDRSSKGMASGYAPLNASSLVALSNLPVTGAGATMPTLASTPTVGNCLNWSANGVHDSGAACGGAGAALGDPGSNGMLKRTALNMTSAAVAGTDYYAPGSAIASSDLPFPGTSAKGGILTAACSAGYAVDYYQSSGAPHCTALSAVAFSPIDPTSQFQQEHFTSGDTSSGRIGSAGMALTTITTAATASYQTIAGHPGVLRLTTPATANTGSVLTFMVSALDSAAMSTKDWDYYWVGALGANGTGLSSSVFYAGIGNSATTNTTGGLGWRVRYDTSLGTPDSNLMFQVCNATGTSGCQASTIGSTASSSLLDSGITPIAGTYYQFYIWHRMSGVGGAETVYMAINGAVASPGYKTFCASGCDGVLTGHEPTTSYCHALVQYFTTAASARSLDTDFMAYYIKGLQLY